jgi:hypothetical protein
VRAHPAQHRANLPVQAPRAEHGTPGQQTQQAHNEENRQC